MAGEYKSGGATLDQRTDRLWSHLQILADFSRLAAERMDLDRLLHLACVQASRATGIKHTKILRHRSDRGDLMTAAGTGWKPHVVGSALSADAGSVAGRGFQSRMPVIVEDYPNDQTFRRLPILDEHGIISLMNVPIFAEHTCWGLLELDSDRPRHFSEEDVVFARCLANTLGAGIARCLAEDETRARAAAAARALATRETLLRELHHRVKNNFMIISSILFIEEHKQRDPDARAAFRRVTDRVSAIALVHAQLGPADGNASLDLAVYLRSLVSSMSDQYDEVRVVTQLESVNMPVDRAVAVGLAVNEMLTNAMKHAFPDRRGVITITMTEDRSTSEGRIAVADDGVGMSGTPRQGSGLRLVEALLGQVNGRLDVQSSGRGTTFELTFPITA